MTPFPHASLAVFLLATASFYLGDTQILYDYPTARLNTTWTNNRPLSRDSYSYNDGSSIRTVLLRGAGGPCFASGFFCVEPCKGFLFSIFVVNTSSESELFDNLASTPPVVWSANRERLVGENATLQLTQDGDLILRDVDGTTVWSSGTTNRSVTGMSLSDFGNLVLFDDNNQSVWSSFDYPTDTLVSGQTLRQDGRKLTSNSSAKDTTSGLFYLSVQPQGLYAFVDSNPPQLYAKLLKFQPEAPVPATLNFSNGGFKWFNDFAEVISDPTRWVIQFVRIEFDGHLRVYGIGPNSRPGVTILIDYTNYVLDYCDYPQVCGPYGVCSDGQCSCFGNASNGETNLFDSITWGQINSGCSLVNAISCQSTGKKSLLALGNLSYFNYIDETAAAIRQTNEASCKQACLANCSCKAALFKHENNVSLGDCYLPTELFSLKNTTSTEYSSSAYMKVQITENPESLARTKSSKAKIIILVTILGSLPLVSILVWFIIKKRGKNRTYPEIGGDDELDQVPGALVRFSFDELQLITEGYKRKLGQGGFGSVFEGTLSNGIKVAVKKLEGVGQGKKEFLAEVETIGSIHHINLVDLVGFCAEKSHRLLVYEYMPKGSLDQWIFAKEEEEAAPLDWQTRRMIILDIAKGLCYLHEECRHRIVHLDVKPQNILLDEKLNAKLADFGLSKLIDREQSEVMTRMRGTPGYLAPRMADVNHHRKGGRL
ncbi:hypothetical protein HPP92_004843 [Vanilla planifolia]|uniref:Receptor-like serine/threonine-protein kinase n=1 Tax=Vanilla planifolia TaxID=51239 RepID=A0A835RLP8_VANPL|nr:hypothetical protein HPP92_004843 [Vanilla planifolia]